MSAASAIVALAEEALDRARLLEHLPQDPEQRDDVDAAGPAMDHRAQLRVRRLRVEAAGRNAPARGPSTRRQRLDRVEHARDAPERQRRRAEPDDLLVRRHGVAADNLDRIGRRIVAVVGLVELVPAAARATASITDGSATVLGAVRPDWGLPQSVPQKLVIGSPALHIGQSAAAKFSGALYSASAKLGTPSVDHRLQAIADLDRRQHRAARLPHELGAALECLPGVAHVVGKQHALAGHLARVERAQREVVVAAGC